MLNKRTEILEELGSRPFFSLSTLSQLLGIKPESARVLAYRFKILRMAIMETLIRRK
jgi:hypothetical protein